MEGRTEEVHELRVEFRRMVLLEEEVLRRELARLLVRFVRVFTVAKGAPRSECGA